MWLWLAPMTAKRMRAACLPRRAVCTAAASRPGMAAIAARPATAPADALTASLRESLSIREAPVGERCQLYVHARASAAGRGWWRAARRSPTLKYEEDAIDTTARRRAGRIGRCRRGTPRRRGAGGQAPLHSRDAP